MSRTLSRPGSLSWIQSIALACLVAGLGCAAGAGTGPSGGGNGGSNSAGRGGNTGSGGSTGTGGTSAGSGGSTSGSGGSNTGSGGSGTSTGGSGGSGNTGSGGAGGSGNTGSGGAGGTTATGGAGGSGTPGTGGSGGGAPPMPVNVYPCDRGAPVITTLAPSTKPPGGLAVDNVPQFISLGWDDNAYTDGMTWILDFMKSKMNPGGRGNACTFDGSPARSTFFNNSHVGVMTDPGIQDAHLRAYREGHEAANHTDTHDELLQRNPDKARWIKELSTCTQYLVDLGIPRVDIMGFRTPFLQQSEQTYEAIVDQKFKYDCSIEHFYYHDGYVWPYTLDNGKAPMHTYQTAPMGKYPGLWEMPVYELMTSTTGYGSVTGFDYNMWISQNMTRQKAVETFKASLQIRLMGGNAPANRVPLLIGTHTDLYSNTNPGKVMTPASIADRRAAIEEFITWALAYHPAVRVVPYAEVMKWMQNPIGLDGTKGR
jgi:hypothetical protein